MADKRDRPDVSLPVQILASLHFLPTAVPNMVGWADLTDSSTVTLDGSSNISSVTDKSGAGNNFGRTDAATRPAYGTSLTPNSVNASNYTGSQRLDWLHNFNQPLTIIVACKNSVNGAFICDGYSGRNAIAFITANAASNSDHLTMYAGTGLGNDGVSASTNIDIITSGCFNTTSSKLRRQGVQIATGTTGSQNDTAGLAFGLSISGYIAQIGLWSRALSDTEMALVENYFAASLGLTL